MLAYIDLMETCTITPLIDNNKFHYATGTYFFKGESSDHLYRFDWTSTKYRLEWSHSGFFLIMLWHWNNNGTQNSYYVIHM